LSERIVIGELIYSCCAAIGFDDFDQAIAVNFLKARSEEQQRFAIATHPGLPLTSHSWNLLTNLGDKPDGILQ
jgi:hypothetical protein